MEIKPEKDELEKLKSTAEDIIKSSRRDYILWSAVLKEVEKEIKNAK